MRPKEVTNGRAGIFLSHSVLFAVIGRECICYRDGRVKKKRREKGVKLGAGVWDAE